MVGMGEKSLLREEIQQHRPFQSRQEEAYLNLQRTAAVLEQTLAHWLKRAELTPTQYNVLRILRGADPEALRCSEVGERMVTPVPDVTRLLDRLEAADLVSRERDTVDRRVVKVGITDLGLERLARLDATLQERLREMMSPLDDAELGTLVELLELVRHDKRSEAPASGAG